MTSRQAQTQDFDVLRKTQLLVEKVADYAIYMLTPEGHVATWNAGARRFKGYDAEEIIGQHFSKFYSAEDQAAGIPATALATAREKGIFEAEGWRYRKDGSRFWASVVIDPIHDDDGQLVGFAKVTRDITEKRETQEALRQSEARFRILVEGVVDYALYLLSPTGEITNWNTGAERIKGYNAAEVIGTSFARFYTPEDQQAGLPAIALNTARLEGRFESEGWRVRKDGSKFRASVVIDAISNDAGELIGFAKITRDVTDRVKLEETKAALQKSQKLETVGQLTGGVAHDFNNILQVIGGNLQMLNDYLPSDRTAQRYIHTSISALERGAKLCSQLLSFARRQPLQPTVVNLGRVLRNMEPILNRALQENIEVEMVVSAGLWNVMLDPFQFENVLLNLAINARDAMPNGGKLTIELGNSMLDDEYVLYAPDVPAGQFVMLAVTDTGIGMDKTILERAVEPFFTTKGEGKGTGLGLSMAFGYVKQSGGHFRLYSEVGHGTTVKMYFPRSADREELTPNKVVTEVTGGSETVLVVEDDVDVQATVVEMLAHLGYRVLRANDAEAALAILKSGMNIDLLFTDVVMPGNLKSTDLARQAQTLFPHIAVLFTSGYTQNAIIHGGRLDPGVQLLSKPYSRDQLALKVRQLLKQDDSSTKVEVEQSAISNPNAGKSVLVVEDNSDTCEICCELLRAIGHRAVGVISAEDALAELSSATFDVLLTDLTLPGMNGLELARIVHARYPDIAIVFASGFDLSQQETSPLNASVIRKPFMLDALKKILS